MQKISINNKKILKSDETQDLTQEIKVNTYREIPPSGICQTFTTQSSEPLAITLSLCGHHAISNTGPLWPPTTGWSAGNRPV